MPRDPVSRLHNPLLVPWLVLTAGGFIVAITLAVDRPLGATTYVFVVALVAVSAASIYAIVRYLNGPASRR